MAKPRQTGSKRQRERTKLEQKQDKARRKAARREEADEKRAEADDGVDPDLAGIVPGPQPLPEEYGLSDEEEEEKKPAQKGA